MFTPFSPFGQNPFTGGKPQAKGDLQPVGQDPATPPEMHLPRSVQYYADYSGCGFWRMIWPEHFINAYQKAIITGQTTMVLDPRFYENVKCVRIQRQATANQLQFVQMLKDIQKKAGFRIVYEIDDIVFREDIPDYNKFKTAFTSDEIRNSSQKIMELCDEITVTNHFMRDYYAEKTGNKNVTVIPNYAPRFWIDQYYSEQKVRDRFRRHKTRPRILYAGSGAHFDVDNRVKHQDDFEHVSDAIIRSRNEFKYVFIGAFPAAIGPYIQNGEMEFHQWQPLYEYPSLVDSLQINMMIAPLQDNTFNKAKSDIKHLEACALGIPCALQNLVTYKNAPIKFDTGDQMVNSIRRVLNTKNDYLRASRDGRQVAKSRWLESPDNLGKYVELFTLPYKHPDRKLINAIQ